MSAAMPWVKVYCDILNDRKLLPLARSTRFTFIEMIVLAGECDADGALIDSSGALDNKFMAWRFDMPLKELERDIVALKEAELIDVVDGALTVLRFRDRQGRKHSERLEQYKKSQQKRRAALKVDTTECQHDVNVDTTLTPRGVNTLEREGEKEREKEEEKSCADAPAQLQSIPVLDSPKKTATSRQPNRLFDAVAEVTASNPKLLGSRIGKCATELSKIGATPEQVHQVATWFKSNDWRGKKGEKLTFATLIEVWDSGIRNEANHSNGDHHVNEPAGFAAIHEAMQDPRYQENK